jgi:predicted dehydrogenase
MPDPVGLAVVGTGPIGRRHLDAIAAEPSCQAVAVVDPAASGAATAVEWNLPHFDDLNDMLAKVAPDGVINASRTHCMCLCPWNACAKASRYW